MGKGKESHIFEVGQATVLLYADQFPIDSLGKPVTGRDAVVVFAEKLRSIFGWSGFGVSEAREMLERSQGSHKSEMLRALEIIEEEDRQKKK